MKISVVIIVYNLEFFIDHAIQSVLKQTREADEVIVVDDCSTDKSHDIINTYLDQIHYFRMPQNSGALLAALQGIKMASGDIVCMLDGDDEWAENKLEVVEKRFFADGNLILLSHNHIRVDEYGKEIELTDDTHKNIANINKSSDDDQKRSDLFRDSILAQKGYWLGSAYSFRRDAFNIQQFERQLMLFDSMKLKFTYLDLVIAPYLVLTNKSKRIGYAADTYFKYRIHANGSLSNNTSISKAINSAMKGKSINELIYHFLKLNNADPVYLKRRKWIIMEYDYLDDLYNNRMIAAYKKFFFLSERLWLLSKGIKEFKRLGISLLLGPKTFLYLKNKFV